MGEMRILATTGDNKIMWSPDNEDEVEAAETMFDELISKGFTAYSVKKDGDKGRKVTTFKSSAGRLILVPPIAGG